MTRPALFLDRDGTLIADAHYLADASRVRLLPDAIDAVRLANAADVPVIIVTNQSGIARGLITSAQYEAVRDQTVTLLARGRAAVHATYHCPHEPTITGPCRCRKPGIGMYEQAAQAHALDLARSAYIGDRWRDVAPAIEVGGMGWLVPGVETPAADFDLVRAHPSPQVALASSLTDAVTFALNAWAR